MNTLEVTGTAGDTITEAATDAKQNGVLFQGFLFL